MRVHELLVLLLFLAALEEGWLAQVLTQSDSKSKFRGYLSAPQLFL